jgi:hypothetical protein
MFSDSGHQILNWVYDIKMNANLNKQTYDKNYNSPSLDNKFRRTFDTGTLQTYAPKNQTSTT